MSKKVLESYVPRHIRLGLCVKPVDFETFQEVVESIPVVASDGKTPVYTQKCIKQVPASEMMSKYKCSAFKLSALVEAGVPLNVVNINHNNAYSIDKLQQICSSVENAEQYIARVEAQQKERESWFSPKLDDVEN